MKVLSLLQPWASLVVTGHKRIETRSWNTKYRGEILIHASNKWTKEQWKLLDNLYFGTALQNESGKIHITCGHIVGKVNLIDTFQFEEDTKEHCKAFFHDSGNVWDFTKKELAFGDYTTGRYGWLLSD